MEDSVSLPELLQLIAYLSLPALVAGLLMQFLWLRSKRVFGQATDRGIGSMALTAVLTIPVACGLGLSFPNLLRGALNLRDFSTWLFVPGILVAAIVVPTVTLIATRTSGRRARM
jgi:hypothetical protein